jgi:hypothetical protein
MQTRTLHRVATIVALFGAAVLSGCGGGAHNALLPRSTSPGQAAGSHGSATFTIHIPKSSSSSTSRRPAYVSPATTQMVLDIQQSGVSIGAPYPETVALTPTSGGCASTLASTICQLTIALSPGSYTANLTMEDASNTPLSAAQSVGFTITAGVANTISITLSGIPYQLLVTPVSQAVHGSQNEGLTVYGIAAQKFIVNALDPDGNIIAGPGSPTFSVSVVGSNSTWTPATPSPTSPNLVTITPPGTNGGSAQLKLSASYSDSTCSTSGAVCSILFSVKNDIQRLYTLSTTTDGYNRAIIYWNDLPAGTGSTGTITPPVASPNYKVRGLTVGPNGDVYVIDCNQGCNGGTIPDQVDIYDRSGTHLQTIVDPGTKAVFNYPTAIAVDSQGNIFVGNSGYVSQTSFTSGANFVDAFAPNTTTPAQQIALDSSGNSEVQALAADAAGNLFVETSYSFNTREYTTPMTAPTLANGTSFGFGGISEGAMVVDPGGVVLLGGNNGVYGFGGAGHTTSYPITPSFTNNNNCCSRYSIPTSLAIDGIDTLYVAECGSICGSYNHNGIDIIPASTWMSCSSATSCYSTNNPNPTSIPESGHIMSIVIDQLGTLYALNDPNDRSNDGSVLGYTPPFSSSSTAVTTFPSGLYFPSLLAISP